jgi:uncharacterized protein YodC (DUF2158 family)
MAHRGQFKAGDVVRLKTGGPLMTIREVDGYDPAMVTCIWYDRTMSYGEEKFTKTRKL